MSVLLLTLLLRLCECCAGRLSTQSNRTSTEEESLLAAAPQPPAPSGGAETLLAAALQPPAPSGAASASTTPPWPTTALILA